jgi:hypothetical protein
MVSTELSIVFVAGISALILLVCSLNTKCSLVECGKFDALLLYRFPAPQCADRVSASVLAGLESVHLQLSLSYEVIGANHDSSAQNALVFICFTKFFAIGEQGNENSNSLFQLFTD